MRIEYKIGIWDVVRFSIAHQFLSPLNHTYGVGIFTNGTPRKIGTVTTDVGGNINNVKLEYACQTQINAINAEVYELVGQDLGAGIAQTKISGDTCF